MTDIAAKDPNHTGVSLEPLQRYAALSITKLGGKRDSRSCQSMPQHLQGPDLTTMLSELLPLTFGNICKELLPSPGFSSQDASS